MVHSKLPQTHILNLAVLPRGEIWPNRCSEAILAVNSDLEVCSLSYLVCCFLAAISNAGKDCQVGVPKGRN